MRLSGGDGAATWSSTLVCMCVRVLTRCSMRQATLFREMRRAVLGCLKSILSIPQLDQTRVDNWLNRLLRSGLLFMASQSGKLNHNDLVSLI